MLNYEFTSPIYLIFLVLYLITSSIKDYDISTYHAINNGQIIRPFGSWITIIHWLDWGIILTLFILNWKYALIIFLVRYLFKVINLLHTLGFFILLPFTTKIPRGVSTEHLEVAKAMFILYDKPLLNSPLIAFPTDNADFRQKCDYARQMFEKLELNEGNLEKIIKALDYLRADDELKSESRIFYSEEKERLNNQITRESLKNTQNLLDGVNRGIREKLESDSNITRFEATQRSIEEMRRKLDEQKELRSSKEDI